MTDLTPLQISRLAMAAKAATPGPWHAHTEEPFDCVVLGPSKNISNDIVGEIGPNHAPITYDRELFAAEIADCEYVALANPSTVLALCEMVKDTSNEWPWRTELGVGRVRKTYEQIVAGAEHD